MRSFIHTAATAASLLILVGVMPPAFAGPQAAIGDHDARGDGASDVLQPRLRRQLSRAEPDALLTVFVHADNAGDATRAATAAGLTVGHRFERVGVVAAEGPAASIRRLADAQGVRHVEANQRLVFHTDTSHRATRGAHLVEEVTDDVGRPVDGRGVSVAVVDTGVDGTHPAFELPDGTSKVVRNVKFCSYGLGFTCFMDVPSNDSDTPSASGHGTHVAGIVGGVPDTTAGGERVRGAAPGATIISLSIGTVIWMHDAARGFEWVLDHHTDPCADSVLPSVKGDCPPIRVVNASFGPSGGGEYDPESLIVKLTDELVNEGIVVVWPAGNSGGDGSDSRVNAFSQHYTPGILSVANFSDRERGSYEGTLAPSSARGKSGRPETYPDLAAPGSSILQACRYTLAVCRVHGDARYESYAALGGTSMAAPHVAGIVAQLLQLDPTLTPGQIEHLLEDTAYQFAFGAPYEPDPRNEASPTSFDKGHGLVDAAAAAAQITGQAPPPRRDLCPDGQPQLTDPAGDEGWTILRLPTRAPAVDVVAGGITTATEGMRFWVEVDELPGDAPSAGQAFNFHFEHDGTAYLVSMRRTRTGDEFYRLVEAESRVIVAELEGSFDPTTDTVSTTLPPHVMNAAAGDRLTALQIVSYQSVSHPGPADVGAPPVFPGGSAQVSADEATTSCIFTLDSS